MRSEAGKQRIRTAKEALLEELDRFSSEALEEVENGKKENYKDFS